MEDRRSMFLMTRRRDLHGCTEGLEHKAPLAKAPVGSLGGLDSGAVVVIVV